MVCESCLGKFKEMLLGLPEGFDSFRDVDGGEEREGVHFDVVVDGDVVI